MPDLTSQFVSDESRLGPGIYKTSINTSVWNTLIPKETWPNGLSDEIRVLTMERNLPENIDVWTTIAANDGSGDTCVPTPDEIPTGQTIRSYQLAQKRFKSLPICVNDTRNAFQVAQQVKDMYDNLTKVVRYTWKRRAMLEYARLAEHKIIAAADLPEAADHFPVLAPTSILTQKLLNAIYYDLISNSAQLDGGSLGMQDGAPQFILVTDMNTSDAILHEANNQNAFLWNSKRVPELLQPLGVDRAYRGFYHTIDTLPRHWNLTGGVWVEVEPYEQVAATKGTKAKLSTAYKQAEYMDSYVFLPSVMSFMVPEPISSVGSGTVFTPQQYMGDFKWLNIPNLDTNPLGEQGLYYANIQSGSKPIHPEFGYVIRHKRCPGDIGLTGCAPNTSGDSSLLSSGENFLV